jgi:hypothetical protein
VQRFHVDESAAQRHGRAKTGANSQINQWRRMIFTLFALRFGGDGSAARDLGAARVISQVAGPAVSLAGE